MKPVLLIKDLYYNRFDQNIIKGINLVIQEGEFVILVGPNGSGKSTFLKLLNGLNKPSVGHVFLGSKDLSGKPVHRIAHDIATLTQDLRFSTFSEMSVLMNMELALTRSIAKPKSQSEIVTYLVSFNPLLAERLHIQAGHLSGGQRQSLALAMCFAHTPRLLLLDEHTSALDPKAANALMEMTNTHVRQKQLTTIMITHSLEHAMNYGDRLIAMGEGKIIADIAGSHKAALRKEQLISLAY